MESEQTVEVAKLVIELVGAILLPIALVLLTRWFTLRKEKADIAKWESDQLFKYIEKLASPNKKEKELSILSLTHLKASGHLSKNLMEAVNSIASDKDPTVAAKAEMLLREDSTLENLSLNNRRLVAELLLPLKIHMDRTGRLFRQWKVKAPAKPNEEIEDAIRDSNLAAKVALSDNWHLIPPELTDDAKALIDHFDAWLEEYEAVRPGGKRLPKPTYVFVGPKGVPFPTQSEKRFRELYKSIMGDKIDT